MDDYCMAKLKKVCQDREFAEMLLVCNSPEEMEELLNGAGIYFTRNDAVEVLYIAEKSLQENHPGL